jgi:hypothetical protein
VADKGAWHGDPNLKAATVERMKAHREADAFAQGFYQQHDPSKALGYKGCALGCMVREQERPHDTDFALLVATTYGITGMVAGAIDDAFETLDFDHCAEFAVAVVEAIPVGADLTAAGEEYWRLAHTDAFDLDRETAANTLLRLVSQAPQVTA